jgi:hypothetical protein
MPTSRKKVLLVIISALLLVIALLIATMERTKDILNAEPPFTSDVSHCLIFKPGCTIPSRSLDAAGEGMSYHFTRYDTYKAPDWHPKAK